MKTFRIGGKAAGVAVAALSAGSGTVQARAPAQVAPQEPRLAPKVLADDEWLITHLNGEELLFQGFKPAEIDDAVAEVAGLLSGFNRPSKPRLEITELREGDVTPPSSEFSSEGCSADAVIAATHTALGAYPDDHYAARQQPAAELNALLCVTSKLLKRPGLQAEVVQCMLEDAEVRDLILGQGGNLDAYLAAVGIHTPGLLPPAAQAAIDACDGVVVEGRQGYEEAANGGGGADLISKLVQAVACAVEQAGSVMSKLGNWLRLRFVVPGMGPEVGAKDGGGGDDNNGAGSRRGSHARGVMGKVLVVAVAVVVMVLLKRPIRFASRPAAA